jgi:hypothetical protein
LRLGVAHCSEFLVDLPDYNHGIYGGAPDGFSDVALAFKHQFDALPEGTTASTIVGLGFPTGTRPISGTGYHPYIQFPWSQAIAEGCSANGMLSAYWFTDQPGGIRRRRRPSISIDRSARMPTSLPNMMESSGHMEYLPKSPILADHTG